MTDLRDEVARIISRLWYQGKTKAVTDRILPLVEAAGKMGHTHHCDIYQYALPINKCSCGFKGLTAALDKFWKEAKP